METEWNFLGNPIFYVNYSPINLTLKKVKLKKYLGEGKKRGKTETLRYSG